MNPADIQQFAETVIANVERVIVGKRQAIELLMVALVIVVLARRWRRFRGCSQIGRASASMCGECRTVAVQGLQHRRHHLGKIRGRQREVA